MRPVHVSNPSDQYNGTTSAGYPANEMAPRQHPPSPPQRGRFPYPSKKGFSDGGPRKLPNRIMSHTGVSFRRRSVRDWLVCIFFSLFLHLCNQSKRSNRIIIIIITIFFFFTFVFVINMITSPPPLSPGSTKLKLNRKPWKCGVFTELSWLLSLWGFHH